MAQQLAHADFRPAVFDRRERVAKRNRGRPRRDARLLVRLLHEHVGYAVILRHVEAVVAVGGTFEVVEKRELAGHFPEHRAGPFFPSPQVVVAVKAEARFERPMVGLGQLREKWRAVEQVVGVVAERGHVAGIFAQRGGDAVVEQGESGAEFFRRIRHGGIGRGHIGGELLADDERVDAEQRFRQKRGAARVAAR